MSVTADQSLDPHIVEARSRVAGTLDRKRDARRALLSAVTLRGGNGGPAVLEDVTANTGYDKADVQRALWGLLAERQLATDEDGNVILPKVAE